MTITIDPNGGDDAWQAAMSQAVGGAQIVLQPYGVYNLSQPFTIPAKCWLVGNYATVYATSTMSQAFCRLTTLCHIENVDIVDLTSSNTGIEVKEAPYFRVEGVSVELFRTGIILTQSWNGAWYDVGVRGGDKSLYGIQVVGKYVNAMSWLALGLSGWVRGMEVGGSEHYGWQIQASVEANREYGIHIIGGAEMWHINDCYFEGNTEADVCIENGVGTKIENCVSIPGSTSVPTRTKRGIWVRSGISTHIGHNVWYEMNPAWQIEDKAYATEVESLKPLGHSGFAKVVNYSKSTTMFGRSVPISQAPKT